MVNNTLELILFHFIQSHLAKEKHFCLNSSDFHALNIYFGTTHTIKASLAENRQINDP